VPHTHEERAAGEVADVDYRVAGPDGDAQDIRHLCRLADISSKSLLLQVVRQDTRERPLLIEKWRARAAPRQQLRDATAKTNRAARRPTSLPTGHPQGLQPEAVVLEKPGVEGRRHGLEAILKELRKAK
jgi:hypothetical protein